MCVGRQVSWTRTAASWWTWTRAWWCPRASWRRGWRRARTSTSAACARRCARCCRRAPRPDTSRSSAPTNPSTRSPGMWLLSVSIALFLFNLYRHFYLSSNLVSQPVNLSNLLYYLLFFLNFLLYVVSLGFHEPIVRYNTIPTYPRLKNNLEIVATYFLLTFFLNFVVFWLQFASGQLMPPLTITCTLPATACRR